MSKEAAGERPCQVRGGAGMLKVTAKQSVGHLLVCCVESLRVCV